MIPVTKAFLPPQEEYNAILKRAWDKKWITNRGDLVLELEEKLKEHLNVQNIIITNNGTIPLQIALKSLVNGGEIITTPFSYVATTSSILWENCLPIFVDIHPEYLTIDEEKIEEAITDKTKAILATHVYGNPCNVHELKRISEKHGLRLIYDAAHCFGVNYDGRSLFDYGDISTCSFHATKIFQTAEGGAMFCNDPDLNHKLYYSHNFGHDGPLHFHGVGINGKISELQAAMGLAMLPYMSEIISERRLIVEKYLEELSDLDIDFLKIRSETDWNYSYFPVLFNNEEQLIQVEVALNKMDVFPRRYFYPSLNTLDFVPNVSMPISESVSKRVMCLPLYVGLKTAEVELITKCIKNHLK